MLNHLKWRRYGMSKEIGQKIAIKFTEEIIGLEIRVQSNKYFRWEFENSRSSTYFYIYGIEIQELDGELYRPSGIVAASSQYSTAYSPDKAFDGSTSSCWRPNRVPAWLQIELPEEILLTGFSLNTQTTSYRPKDFRLLGSKNGIDWTVLLDTESPATSYWKSLEVPLKVGTGNELAFEITGKEFLHVDGPLINKKYKIDLVEQHPSENNALLATINKLDRFNNAEGHITVKYDAGKGTLQGLGGPVESFEETFLPEDLFPKPNPYAPEYIEIKPSISIDYIEVTYNYRFGEEAITAKPNITIDFIDVGEINP